MSIMENGVRWGSGGGRKGVGLRHWREVTPYSVERETLWRRAKL